MKFLTMALVMSFGLSTYAAEVNVKKSEFKWTASKVTGKHYGTVPIKKAELKTDKKGNVKGGEFVLDLKSFTVDDLSGKWEKKFLTHMKSEDFFDISKYPEAKLVLTKLKKGKATGKLTIRGKTNTVNFPYTFKNGVYAGTLKFDRTKFDMKYGSTSFFKSLGDKAIDNEVVVDFKVALKK
jgi:polyisoprenoid-binding protein YceI